MFEAGDILYYVDKQGEVYSFEVTEDMLEHKSEMPAAFLDDYVFKPYAPVTVYDDYGRLWLWSAKGHWTGSGMGAGFEVEYSSKVADVFIAEEEALVEFGLITNSLKIKNTNTLLLNLRL